MAARESRGARLLLIALLVVECVYAIHTVGAQLPGLWEQRWVQDDAYVSFRYARNLVEGNGLVYNPGERVEGYTNFLWTMLATIPLLRGAEDPLPFMHRAGAVLWVASYGVLLLIGIRFWSQGIWAGPLALVPLAHHWSFNIWFFSGMETPLVCFLTLLSVFLFSFDPEEHPWSLFFASLSGVLLTMTRPDGVVTLAALAATGLAFYWRRILYARRWRTYVLLPALPVLLVYVPFNVWRISYYGSFFPNTYYAKVAYLPYYERGWDYLMMYLRTYGLTPYVPFIVAGAAAAPLQPASRYLLSSFMVAAFVAFYVVRLGGDFMEWRFLTPVTGLVVPSIVGGASLVAQELFVALGSLVRRATSLGNGWSPMRGARLCGWLGGVAIATSLLVTTSRATPNEPTAVLPGQETVELLRRYADPGRYDWRDVARLFADVIPQNARIATTSAGIIPYFCNRPCLDLHGLTDPKIAHAPVDEERRGRMGHEHWLDDPLTIRRRGVDVLLPWADPSPYARALARPPMPLYETVSARLPDGRYVDFLILNPGVFDRAALESDPRLVFYGMEKVADKNEFYAQRERFRSYNVIDHLDWLNGYSENTHDFREEPSPDAPRRVGWCTKFLHYPPPLGDIQLEDDGRRVYGAARWKVFNLHGSTTLVLLARFARANEAHYQITINGHEVPDRLSTWAGEEAWEETFVVIPAGLVREGTNELRMSRVTDGDTDAEIYSMWFLQPRQPG